MCFSQLEITIRNVFNLKSTSSTFRPRPFPGSKVSLFWIHTKGYKKYPFNPAYYPQARGRHPVTWKITRGNRYKPFSKGNNAHNVPLFANWGSFRHSSLRVNDPIHGEKYMYPHEITVIFAKNITVIRWNNSVSKSVIRYVTYKIQRRRRTSSKSKNTKLL